MRSSATLLVLILMVGGCDGNVGAVRVPGEADDGPGAPASDPGCEGAGCRPIECDPADPEAVDECGQSCAARTDACEAECLGVDCGTAFDPELGRSVVVDESGALTLSGEAGIANPVIWIANSGEGTVSKVDTETRVELGRYRTGPSAYPDPSRSTVNAMGDVVSVNRTEGSATKILASGCTDLNGDGLRTSTGPGDILPWGQDDCVVWHLEGMPGARGSAVELRSGLDTPLHEYVWVGAYNESKIYEIDSEAGAFTGRVIDTVTPYGAAMGPGGFLWTFGSAGQWMWGMNALVRIDTTTLERTVHEIPQGEYPYGLTVDGEGRVWIGGSVARFDPSTGAWDTPPVQVTGGGIAVDANGDAFVGEYGMAWHVNGETMAANPIPNAGGHGWAIDFDGFAWSIPWGWVGFGGAGGSAVVVDPATDTVAATVTGFVGCYTYSDMTGFQLVNATNPIGRFPHVFEGCSGMPAQWARLSCEVDAPAGSAVSFRVRLGNAPGDLATASWIEIGTVPPSECPIDLPPALAAAGLTDEQTRTSLLEVEATLTSADRQSRPVLRSFGVSRTCADVFF